MARFVVNFDKLALGRAAEILSPKLQIKHQNIALGAVSYCCYNLGRASKWTKCTLTHPVRIKDPFYLHSTRGGEILVHAINNENGSRYIVLVFNCVKT